MLHAAVVAAVEVVATPRRALGPLELVGPRAYRESTAAHQVAPSPVAVLGNSAGCP